MKKHDKQKKSKLSFLYKGIKQEHRKTIIFINIFVMLFVLLILVKTLVYFDDPENSIVWGVRYVGPYIITLIGATMGGSLVIEPSRKMNYSFKSILLFLIYAVTPLYPTFYLIRLFLLPLHTISLFLGYSLSFIFNPLLIKYFQRTKLYSLILQNKKISLRVFLILLFVITYPGALFGINPACIAYGVGQGWGFLEVIPSIGKIKGIVLILSQPSR